MIVLVVIALIIALACGAIVAFTSIPPVLVVAGALSICVFAGILFGFGATGATGIAFLGGVAAVPVGIGALCGWLWRER